MAHVTLSRPAPFGAVSTLRLVNFVANSTAQVSAWNNARKTANELAKLSDHQLSDIGLDRNAINSFSAGMTHR